MKVESMKHTDDSPKRRIMSNISAVVGILFLACAFIVVHSGDVCNDKASKI